MIARTGPTPFTFACSNYKPPAAYVHRKRDLGWVVRSSGLSRGARSGRNFWRKETPLRTMFYPKRLTIEFHETLVSRP
jgi:hypothetical protein